MQLYVRVHTSHGVVTLAFEDSAEAQRWFAALRDAIADLNEVGAQSSDLLASPAHCFTEDRSQLTMQVVAR